MSAILLGVIAAGCTPRVVPPPPAPLPSTPDLPPSDSLKGTYLRFTPGLYRFEFSQTAHIQGDGATDTLPGIISTRALINARITAQPDLSVTVTISFDSITIDTQGSIPTHRANRPMVLDSVIQAVFSPSGSVSEVHLADSLCAYSQFVTAAQDLLLPELGFETPTPMRRSFTDTTTQHSCRAGTRIEMISIRHVQGDRHSSNQVELEEHTEVHGVGLLRRDSITVSGSVSTRGRAQFAEANRLPALVKTQSEGTIKVRLGDKVTTFRQRSDQQIRLVSVSP
jgi:hypothetical protein